MRRLQVKTKETAYIHVHTGLAHEEIICKQAGNVHLKINAQFVLRGIQYSYTVGLGELETST